MAATFDAPLCGSNARFIVTVANALVDQATDQKTAQGNWWAVKWCRPQSSAPLSRLVAPPSTQWMRW